MPPSSFPLRLFSAGLDIGGTLCKLCYFEKRPRPGEPASDTAFREKMRQLLSYTTALGQSGQRDESLEFESEVLGGRLYLLCFETRRMESFLQMVKAEHLIDDDTVLCCTGGGARKYARAIKEMLGVELPRTDELQCLVDGINLVLQHPGPELYTVDHRTYREDQSRTFMSSEEQKSIFPYLLVNVGSGVSILKVNEDGTHDRVGGSSLGGATFYGLCALVTGVDSFDEAMDLAERGNASNVDLLVGDIYGGDYDEYGLSSETVAASLGKLVRPRERGAAQNEDVARGILDAITNNVGSLAMLHARTHKVGHVVFAGNFLRRNPISIARLTYAFDFWSKGAMKAVFLKHEGYLGALGALAYSSLHHTHPTFVKGDDGGHPGEAGPS